MERIALWTMPVDMTACVIIKMMNIIDYSGIAGNSLLCWLFFVHKKQ